MLLPRLANEVDEDRLWWVVEMELLEEELRRLPDMEDRAEEESLEEGLKLASGLDRRGVIIVSLAVMKTTSTVGSQF